jgi:uncharacterized membrane protein YqjE
MTPHSIPLENDRPHGVADNMRSLMRAVLRYAEARLRLFWLESADVFHRVLLLIALAVAALAGVIVTYAALMVALVLWIARTWWDGDALPAVILIALAHLLAAGASVAWMFRAARRGEVFHATLSEFREDRRWLEETQTSSN